MVTEKELEMESLLPGECLEMAAEGTDRVLKECLEGKGLVGPFNNIDNLIRDLNED